MEPIQVATVCAHCGILDDRILHLNQILFALSVELKNRVMILGNMEASEAEVAASAKRLGELAAKIGAVGLKGHGKTIADVDYLLDE